MPKSTVWILKYVKQCYVEWFWTISSLGAPDVLQTVFSDPENEIFSLSVQEYEEMEEERTRKMHEKWPMMVAARQVDDTPVLFNFFFVSEKPSESLFFIPE